MTNRRRLKRQAGFETNRGAKPPKDRGKGIRMQVLARMIQAALMSAAMVRIVTLIATFITLGLPPDFLKQ